ncbi:MAG: oligosaccharide flippase family protein [Lachnospiraceae bacterium]|nr:oligosaccharide flippase family protein [Lachnospiraceae bacterium]
MNLFNKFIKSYYQLSRPAKASLWFTVCYVIQRGLQFLVMPIYTRIMTSDEYGVYSVFLSWFNLICVFSSLNIYSGTFNKAMVKYENQRDRYISSVQYLTLLIGLLFTIFIIVFNNEIYKWTGYSFKLQLLLCANLLFFPSLQYWSQKQRFLYEYKNLVLITLFSSLLNISFGIIFVLINDDKSFALIFVTVLIQVVINCVIFVDLSIKGKCFYHFEYWIWSIKTSIPLIPHYLSEILLGHADRLMINHLCGSSQAGIYNIVYQISMVMTILRTGINGAFTPWLYYAIKQNNVEDIKRVTNLLTILMSMLTVLFMLIGPEIITIVAPEEYYEAVVDIPAIMVGSFFIYVYVLFSNVEIYFEHTSGVAIASVVAAVINIVLNWICINHIGYLAAGYTTMISYIIMAIMHYLFLKKIIKDKKEVMGIFDFRFMLCISIILILSSMIILKVYKYIIVRMGLITLLLVFGILKIDVFSRLLRDLKKRD